MNALFENASKECIGSALEYAMERLTEEERTEMTIRLMDGHLCEETARYRVSRMVPVALFDSEGKPWHGTDVNAYLSAMGMTAERIASEIKMAESVARQKSSEIGISLKSIDTYGIWDMYWCLAMMVSDYWMTVNGNMDEAAMLSYQWLSDPDR